jgi:hypothetical protein
VVELIMVQVRRAENDIIAVYGLLEVIQRTVDQQTVTLAHHSVLLNSHTVRLDRVETRLEGVETRLEGVETRLDGVETRLDEHGGMLKEILRRLPASN